ncbi:MAG: XRE family transcriptional regulator, partial [Acetatifactor sp.]|nr:XRE family transcriptional regulator [Acetatifactor sp.]
QAIYEGILIKESLEDDTVIDLLHVHKVELWDTGGKPKYWTALFFTCNRKDFPEQISRVMASDPDNGGNWFVDFRSGGEKYIVFKNRILKYRIGNQAEKDSVCSECRKMGIPEEQMHWPE